MKLNITLPSNVKKSLAFLQPVARRHYFIVLLIMLGGMVTAVYFVNETLNIPTDSSYQAESLQKTIGTQFNKNTQGTIDKIEALQRSSEQNTQPQTLPSGRINPFAE